MNRLQWIVKMRIYSKSKAINSVLVILICIQLIFSLYLFVPMVSEKVEMEVYPGRGYDNYYGEYGQYTNEVLVRLKPKTRYSLRETEISITLWCGNTPYDMGRETIWGTSCNFTYGYNETGGKATHVSVEIISVETESMTSDILMLLLSVAGVLLGSIFLIGRIRMELKMPSE